MFGLVELIFESKILLSELTEPLYVILFSFFPVEEEIMVVWKLK